MFGIRDMQSAGRIMAWVKKEPTHLPKEQYVELPDFLYERGKNGTFWVDQNGKWTYEKPYTFKYHYLDNGRWRLDHQKVEQHINETKLVLRNNVVTYIELGLNQEESDYLYSQIDLIQTLDDLEEFCLIQLGGKFETVYSYRYNIAF